jgi:hypothetical protein
MFGKRAKCRWVLASLALFLLVVVNYRYFFHSYGRHPSKGVLGRYSEWEKAQTGRYWGEWEEREMFFMADAWPAVVAAVEVASKSHILQAEKGWLGNRDHKLPQSLVTDSPLFLPSWDDCWGDQTQLDPLEASQTSYFRMTADPICNYLWMLRLRTASHPLKHLKMLTASIRSPSKA